MLCFEAVQMVFLAGQNVQCDLTFFPPSSWREVPVEVNLETVENTTSIQISLSSASDCM
jgi:hypothetical protein